MTVKLLRKGCMDCGYAWNGHELACPECRSEFTFHDNPVGRIVANDQGERLSIAAVTGASITASAETRTLAGDVVRYATCKRVNCSCCTYGRTSRGRLKVWPGALRYPSDLTRVKLTEEHDRKKSRGYAAGITDPAAAGQTVRASMRVSDGPLGDAALLEAQDHTRDGFSFDVIDARIEGDTITSALVIAIGQVGIPAYDDMRIDTIAASNTNPGEIMLTAEQLARMAELITKGETGSLSDQEQAELDALKAMAAVYPPNDEATEPAAVVASTEPAAATTEVAASMPAIPGGVPQLGRGGARRAATQTRSRNQFWTPGDLQHFVDAITGNAAQGAGAITAALADITHADHSSIIEPPAWSGELWSGLEYEPIWTDLFTQGELTNFEGKGWRFTTKLEIKDYAGNKVEIPTSTVETEPSSYEAARMAVGVDIDRKFFDFNNAANQAFLAALPVQARESWAKKLDVKVRAYALAQAIAAEGVGAQPTLLKAAAVAIRALRRREVLGRSASTWVVVNDDDLFTLMDYNQLTLPGFLDLWGIDPKNFRSDQLVPAGTVVAGARQAAEVKVLPGSPLRFDAQNLVNGGVDEAFFGYWAIEEHHTSGIAKATYTEPVEP
jgi:hypothetical protein